LICARIMSIRKAKAAQQNWKTYKRFAGHATRRRAQSSQRRCLIKWFKHDSNASADAKLRRVRMKYGMAGYGLYWYCLELIAMGVEANKLTFELEHDAEIIAHDTGINYAVVQEMMVFMCDLGLFENTDGRITCLKMATRLDQSMTSNPGMRKIISTIKNHDPIMTPSRNHHDPIMMESCKIRLDKNRKEKNTKDIGQNRKRFVPPTIQEVTDYVSTRPGSMDAERFIDFYESKGWMVGKNKMRDWQAAVRNWEKRDDGQIRRTGKGNPRSNESIDAWSLLNTGHDVVG